jgi:predicted Abi (CAAX) family protease
MDLLESIFARLLNAIILLPTWQDWINAAALLTIYSLIALPLGFYRKFLRINLQLSWQKSIKIIFISFFTPALLEEIFFRVLLLPNPKVNLSIYAYIWISFSLILFIIYHPLNAITLFKSGRKTFFDPIFLSLATLLGIICTITYLQSASLWTPVVLHWIIVVVWLTCLGGYKQLH